ncbi:hypothetical protein [Sorangium sp. So ce1151]|uniref:hypothetical protein n=1 Tax=Sorangium sp. So ce1151 TaxID=3133332 RepID=UPI003F61CBD1
MTNVKSNHGNKQDPGNDDGGGGPIMEQIPVSTNKSTKVWIAGRDIKTFLQIIVTNNRLVPGFDMDTEYWYTSTDVSITDVPSVTFRSESGPYSEEELIAYVEGYRQAFTTRQTIGTSGWAKGAYAPTAAKKRLYKAVDPDDSTKQIGLLIEQGSDNALTGITWYKQTNTSGTLFARTPASLTFTMVTHEGSPSTSPSDIASGAWYHAHAS